jgi:hypothetical protein
MPIIYQKRKARINLSKAVVSGKIMEFSVEKIFSSS